MHMDAGQARTLRFAASVPMIILVGPTYDTFASLPGAIGGDNLGTQSDSLEFDPDSAADYTVVIGTGTYSAKTIPYTLTIGAEHVPSMERLRFRPRSAVTQSSKSRFRPLVVQHRSTPLSAGRRGR